MHRLFDGRRHARVTASWDAPPAIGGRVPLIRTRLHHADGPSSAPRGPHYDKAVVLAADDCPMSRAKLLNHNLVIARLGWTRAPVARPGLLDWNSAFPPELPRRDPCFGCARLSGCRALLMRRSSCSRTRRMRMTH